MPRPRFARLDVGKQRRILEAAASEFAAHGYQHASLNHVIDAVGLSKGLFYYYFDSKADLFSAVVELVWQTLFQQVTLDVASLDERTFWPRLRAIVTELQKSMRARPWLAGVTRLFYHPLDSADIDGLVNTKIVEARTWLQTLLSRGQTLGLVRTDLPLDLLLDVLAAADQAADHWLLDRWEGLEVHQQEEMADRVFDLWRRIAEPRSAMAGARAAAPTPRERPPSSASRRVR